MLKFFKESNQQQRMNPNKHFNAWRVVGEAAKLFTVHQTLTLFIILLSLTFSSFLFTINFLFISPLLNDIFVNLYAINSTSSDGLEHSSFQATIKKDIKKMAIIQCVFFAISVVIFAFMTIAMIHVASLTYIGRHNNVTLMEMFAKIRRSWRGPMVTQLYVSSLDLTCKLIFVTIVGIFLYLIFSGYRILIAVVVITALLALHLYIKLTMVWSLSSVLSVVEEDLQGMMAIARAKELIKVKRRESIAINFVLVMVAIVIFVLYTLSMQGLSSSLAYQLANGLAMANASVLVNMFSVMVYVVIYYEFKKECGDEEIMPMKGKFVYDNDDYAHHYAAEIELLDLDEQNIADQQ